MINEEVEVYPDLIDTLHTDILEGILESRLIYHLLEGVQIKVQHLILLDDVTPQVQHLIHRVLLKTS
jgi:hypothetical protein